MYAGCIYFTVLIHSVPNKWHLATLDFKKDQWRILFKSFWNHQKKKFNKWDHSIPFLVIGIILEVNFSIKIKYKRYLEVKLPWIDVSPADSSRTWMAHRRMPREGWNQSAPNAVIFNSARGFLGFFLTALRVTLTISN